MRFLLLLVFPAFLAVAGPARASCPEERGLPRYSNLELLAAAEVVVLARPIDFLEADGRTRVKFRVEETLKGSVDAPYLTLPGLRAFQGRSRDADFSKVRPGARTGACVAYDYRESYPYLLVLERRGRGFRLLRAQGARLNEEVDGPQAPWVKAARLYLEVAKAAPGAKRQEALAKLTAQARTQGGFGTTLLADLEAHAGLPTPPKAYAELMALPRRPDFDRDAVLWAFAHGGHAEARPLVKRLLAEGEAGVDLAPLATYLARVRDHESVPLLARAFLEPARRGDRVALLDALISLAEAGDRETFVGLLATGAEDHALTLAAWLTQHGGAAAAAEAIRKRAAAKVPADRRLAVALARTGDEEVVRWAVEHADPGDDARPAAFAVLAASPLPLAESALSRQISGGNDAPLLALRALADPAVPGRLGRLGQLADRGRGAPDERALLRQLLEDAEEPAAVTILERWEAKSPPPPAK